MKIKTKAVGWTRLLTGIPVKHYATINHLMRIYGNHHDDAGLKWFRCDGKDKDNKVAKVSSNACVRFDLNVKVELNNVYTYE